MKASTQVPISFQQLDSANTASVQTATIPAGTSAVLLSVETTDARVTFEGTAPDASHGHVIPAGQGLTYVLIGPGATIKHASTASAHSLLDITYLG